MDYNFWTRNADNLTSIGSWDVAVVGAGAAGIAAAISAANSGAKVILIENHGFPGGIATAACVPNLMGFDYHGSQIVRGIGDELVRNLAEAGEAAFKVGAEACPDPEPIGSRPIEHAVTTTTHGIRVVANRMLKRAGVNLLYYTRMLGGGVQDGYVKSIVIDRAEGPARVEVKMVIDASGDANFLYRIGAETLKCPADVAMTKTMIFQMSNVRNFNRKTVAAKFRELIENGNNPVATQSVFMGYGELHEGAVGLNYTEIEGDALSSQGLTGMDIEMREQVSTSAKWFKKKFDGFENAYIKETPAQVGIRAGRVSVCDETITQHDIDENTSVENPIGLGLRRYGDHGLKRIKKADRATYKTPRPIPMGALLPVGINNVVAAGRCIGVQPKVITSVRYMGQCFATGQAAGVISAIGAKGDASVHNIVYGDVRTKLLEQGAILG